MFPGDEPPIVVPVHNYGVGGSAPPFWQPPPRGLGWRHALFNALYVSGNGSKADLDPGITAWVDSGGFLFITRSRRRPRIFGAPDDEDLVEHVLWGQERFGADIAFTLDYPLTPNLPKEEAKRRIAVTARNAGLAYQLRTRATMKIYVVLHYRSRDELAYAMRVLGDELRNRAGIRLDEVDGYAVGGLVPHRNNLATVVSRIIWLRKIIGDKPLHVLGIASALNVPLLYAAGATSMDSKTYIMGAAVKHWFTPLKHYLFGAPSRIPARRYGDLRPAEICRCPVCATAISLREIAGNMKRLALHNLYVILESAALARANPIHILKLLAKRYSRARKAVEIVLNHIRAMGVG